MAPQHFKPDEFAQPARYGLPAEPYPVAWLTDTTRYIKLVKALETIRTECGNRPMLVLSGYRSVEYNRRVYAAVGQPPTQSQHSEGRAADIRVLGMSANALHDLTLDLYARGDLDIGGLGQYASFIHVDVRTGGLRLARWRGHGG